MDNIRLPSKTLEAIVAAFSDIFLQEDHLWIFGSRVDMQARGGDIDLYIETFEKDIDKAIEYKSKFISRLWRIIGEQKIDVVLNIKKLDHKLEIHSVARENGIMLK